jgi:murein DD-endopeptidase MepM/ murein hydrolase activator NlpD
VGLHGYHNGFDISAPIGTPLIADGKVTPEGARILWPIACTPK